MNDVKWLQAQSSGVPTRPATYDVEAALPDLEDGSIDAGQPKLPACSASGVHQESQLEEYQMLTSSAACHSCTFGLDTDFQSRIVFNSI